MNKWRKALMMLVLLALTGSMACSLPGKVVTEGRGTTVERGELVAFVTGSGSLATRQEARLSFRTAGKIAEVFQQEGDRVTQDQALASLETDSLMLAKKQAEVNLSAAEAAQTQAEKALEEAEYSRQTLEQAWNDGKSTEENLKQTLLNAQISLGTAEYNLEQTRDLYTFSDIKTAKGDVDDAQDYLDELLAKAGKFLPVGDDGQYPEILEYILGDYVSETPGYELWQRELIHAQSRLNTAQDRLDAILTGSDPKEVAVKQRQVEVAQLALDQAQRDYQDLAKFAALDEMEVKIAEDAVGQASQSVVNARQSVELARQSLELAEKNLNEATIKAPFDGVVASVQVKPGDVVDAAMTIVQVVRPTMLELIVEIDEIDVSKVAPGQEVRISVDAYPDKKYIGVVASVYPVPTKVTGLVLYNVKTSLTVPESAGLKIGMRATSDIVVEKKANVIKVPDKAVKSDGNIGYYVEVLVDNEAKKRPVTIGMSNGTETEITHGLKEGEIVLN